MPDIKGRFTRKEEIAIAAAVASGDLVEGARRAGYAQPYAAANQLENRPAVMAEIRRREEDRLNNDLLPLAVDRLQKILSDDTENSRNHIAAAKLVLDNTINKRDGDAGAREPHEMTAEELAENIANARRALDDLANNARDVTPQEIETESPGNSDVFG